MRIVKYWLVRPKYLGNYWSKSNSVKRLIKQFLSSIKWTNKKITLICTLIQISLSFRVACTLTYSSRRLYYRIRRYIVHTSLLQNKEIYCTYTEGPLSGATWRPSFTQNLCSIAGLKAEQPASTACLLAVLLINMHLPSWSNGGQHAQCDVREDTNFKGSDASDPSVYTISLFCVYPKCPEFSRDLAKQVKFVEHFIYFYFFYNAPSPRALKSVALIHAFNHSRWWQLMKRMFTCLAASQAIFEN